MTLSSIVLKVPEGIEMFIFWLFQYLVPMERFILVLYVLLKNMSLAMVLVWLMLSRQFDHALFLLWGCQRLLERVLLFLDQNQLRMIFKRIEGILGQSIMNDLHYWVDVKSQKISRYGLCCWVGIQGTATEFVAVMCLLTMTHHSNVWVRCCFGAFIYYILPCSKVALVLWVLVK